MASSKWTDVEMALFSKDINCDIWSSVFYDIEKSIKFNILTTTWIRETEFFDSITTIVDGGPFVEP